jgi:hypothetical protein
MVNNNPLSQFEQRLARLIEGGFARLFAGRLHPHEVATRVARAMDDSAEVTADGDVVAPDTYVVYLTPDDHAALIEASPDLVQSLAEGIVELALRAEMRLLRTPTVTLRTDAGLVSGTIRAEAYHTHVDSSPTSVLEVVRAPTPTTHPAPRNPQLVLPGTQYVPLTRPIINIGRRHDNHIVIDDARISRAHAQLRLRFAHYVIYDLNSKGGTYLNGHRVSESILRPGDVISLAGVNLIYLEEDENAAEGAASPSDTQIRPPTGLTMPDSDSMM